MNNTKCPNCGLVNYAGASACHRCQAPFFSVSPDAAAGAEPAAWPGPRPAAAALTAQSAPPRQGAQPVAAPGIHDSFAQPPDRETLSAFRPELSAAEQAELEAAEKDIKGAWQAAAVIGALTGALGMVGMMVSKESGLPGADVFIDVGLILGLAYGISRRSRVCAGMMLAYYILAKLYMISTGRQPLMGILIAVVITKYLYKGLIGTMTWRRLTQDTAK